MALTFPIRRAATVMLAREEPAFQVLMVRRHQQIDFAPGAMVFPGGKVENHDLDPRWMGYVLGWHEVPKDERGPRISAIREVFEESGILLGAGKTSIDEIGTSAFRKAIESGTLFFLDFVRQQGIVLDLRVLTLFSRWLTPPVIPKRFDTYFYLALAPSSHAAVPDGRETVEAEWSAPDVALNLAAMGKRTMMFPTRMNLKLLAATPSYREAVTAAASRSCRLIQPRVEIRGPNRFILLDPQDGYGLVEELLSIP